MKIFILFLMIINVIYFLWQTNINHVSKTNAVSFPDNVQQLVLLKEIDGEEESTSIKILDEQASVSKMEQSGSEITVEETGEICLSFGPFATEADLVNYRGLVRDKVSDVSQRIITEKVLHRYWVYLPALENRNHAITKSKQLARNEIDDYYIVLKGESKNAISLGHYREKKHAERRIKAISERGFNPDLKLIHRDIDRFWLDVVTKEDDGSHQWLSKLASERDLGMVPRDCTS